MKWRRIAGRVITWSLGPPLVLLATLVGTSLALAYSPPGRSLLVRAVSSYLSGSIAGTLEVGGFGGGLFRRVVLEDVALRDSTGALVIAAPRIEAHYLLPELLAGRIVFGKLEVQRPTIRLMRLRRGIWNYQAVFRSGGPGDGSAPSLVELRDVSVTDADIVVRVPTEPSPPPEPISRNGATPAAPEVEMSDDGLMRVYRASNLSGEFASIRVSTPQDDPLRVVIDSLSTRLSDPALSLVDATGTVIQGADTLRFDLSRVELPRSTLAGAGTVRWPNGPIQYDFRMTADTVALGDLRWIQPDFPDWTGKGAVVARSRGDHHTDFALSNLSLGASGARATGKVVAMVDDTRGFGVRNLDLNLTLVPLAVVRPYLDTLPMAGWLDGNLRADGYRDAMTLAGDLRFRDALVPGRPSSHLVFSGGVGFGGGDGGTTFNDLVLNRTTLDLGTISRLFPAVALPGTLNLTGAVNGPTDAVSFRGVMAHQAPDDALSRVVGKVGIDSRGAEPRLDIDARLDPLSFAALRTGYPEITARGTASGQVRATGALDSLSIDAQLEGDFGGIEASGTVALTPPRYAADSLALQLRRFNVDDILGNGTSTALNGRVVLRGVIDPDIAPQGVVTLALGQSRIGGATLDRASGLARSDGRVVSVHELETDWDDGRLTAEGSLGWTSPDSGGLHLEASATSLAPFDSLVRAATGMVRDTTTFRQLDGIASGSFDLSGSLDRLAVSGKVSADSLVIDDWQVGSVRASVATDSLGGGDFAVNATVDSASKADLIAEHLGVELSGKGDSLRFGSRVVFPDAILSIGGLRVVDSSSDRFDLDSLGVKLPHQDWRLVAPVTATDASGSFVLADTARLVTGDGSGLIEMSGSIPGAGPGDLETSMVGLNLSDLYALLQRDTTGVSGTASLDFRLAGTRDAPLMRGNAMLTGPVFGDVRPPLIRAAFDYRNRLLRSDLTFWKTGDPMLQVDLALPLDLALASRARRKLPGEISIKASADSADLAIIQALTPSLTQTRGALSLDLSIDGTWNDPRLEGTLDVIEGRMTIPTLNVRYGPIFGHARFVGDSMVVDSLFLSSGEGDMVVKGQVRFPNLGEPQLNLAFNSSGFLAINVPEFLVLRPTGSVQLTGPLSRPVLQGKTIRLDNSTLYFTDLITKDVIKLEDPAYKNLVDLEQLHRQRLGAAFQNRFLDSLRVDNIRFVLGTNDRLYSEDADIQLEGAVTVQKTGSDYLVNGNLSAVRGTYTLRLGGFLTTEFQVERGSVQFFGTPDLNATVDLRARHLARTRDGDELPVIATITGTIEVPKVELSTPNNQYAQIDIISYLLFGRPYSQLGSGSRDVLAQSALGLLGGQAAQAFGQAAGLDLVELRPGVSVGSSATASFNRLAIGKQLGRDWFITANAGFCLGGEQQTAFSARNFGASLEYRLSQEWRLQASAEPVQTCATNRLSDAFNTVARRYQIGVDVLWQREY